MIADYLLFVPCSLSLENCFLQELGGARQRLSFLTNAQTSGIEFLPQISGLVCRQPYVCVSLSFGCKGA